MLQPINGLDTEEQAIVSSVKPVNPSPRTISRLVKRLRALTFNLLPVEVPVNLVTSPTSRFITPQVVKAYVAAAGDLVETLPYCLLRARKEFTDDAAANPAAAGENNCRAVACERIAREVISVLPPDRLPDILSRRFVRRSKEVDKSQQANAIEMATDQHCTIFLSCREVQDVVHELWAGRLIQKHKGNRVIEFVVYPDETLGRSVWAHMDPVRISVPRYQNMMHIMIWIVFLFIYSRAVREPVERLDPEHDDFDGWEIAMYIMALAFGLGDIQKSYKLLRFVAWNAMGFWNFVSLVTDLLMVAAFTLRLAGLNARSERASDLHTLSFQVLSFAAPLIWMRLIPVFDGFEYVGTMQICVARMLQESSIFFCLLALLGIGFTQGLFALDAADGHSDESEEVVNSLIQALLQAPNYDRWKGWAPGLFLYYLWNVATVLILLNILISLFSTAYDDVVEDAGAEYLAYFADKTVTMVRAPDEYTYPAPFNLIELAVSAPMKFVLRKEAYDKLNRALMLTVFFIPLTLIAFYEARLDPSKNRWIRSWLSESDQGFYDTPEYRDPEPSPEDAAQGMRISVVPFEELVKVFPDAAHSTESVILRDLERLRAQVGEAEKRALMQVEAKMQRLETQLEEMKEILLGRK